MSTTTVLSRLTPFRCVYWHLVSFDLIMNVTTLHFYEPNNCSVCRAYAN
jgi:hypothetical protein